MKVAVLHGAVPPGAPADELDVLVEADAVSGALAALGHDVSALTATPDMERFAKDVLCAAPDIVFNLVETLDGRGSLIHLCPGALDMLGVPYTGSPAGAVYTTSNKLLAKRALWEAGIPTPDWVEQGADGFKPGASYIIKSVWEHASIGLDDDSVAAYDAKERLISELELRRPILGGECFAEEFIEGREFNISLVELDGAPVVLPPAEMRFSGFPESGRKMVGYRAKWDEGSEEYRGTRRSFVFPDTDSMLLEHMAEISKSCWRLFGLGGYARVDFRVDGRERPWVLEVNINPCISPDSGFVAAAAMSGTGYGRLVGGILDAGLARRSRQGAPA